MKRIITKVWMLGFASLLGITLTGCSTNDLELKKDSFIVEYGETISMDAKDYLTKDEDKEILKDAKVIIKLNRKAPIDVGTYNASIKYKSESIEFKIKVKDTKAPVFKDWKDTIEVEQGYAEDITTLFTVEELSEYTITADTSKVDFNVPGEYEAKVTAKDKYKNKVSKTVKIIVKEKAQETPEIESTTNTTTSGNANAGGSTNNGGTNIPSGSNSSTGGTTNSGSGSSSGGGIPITPSNVCDQPVGNSGRWFSTYDEAYNYAYGVLNDFSQQYESFTSWGNDICGYTINFS